MPKLCTYGKDFQKNARPILLKLSRFRASHQSLVSEILKGFLNILGTFLQNYVFEECLKLKMFLMKSVSLIWYSEKQIGSFQQGLIPPLVTPVMPWNCPFFSNFECFSKKSYKMLGNWNMGIYWISHDTKKLHNFHHTIKDLGCNRTSYRVFDIGK